MTKKEMEEHHQCDLRIKDRKIKELEDYIITLIQTHSHISVEYQSTPWRDRKPEEGEYDLSMRPFNFGNDGTRHVARAEHYPELVEKLEEAREQVNSSARWAYQDLGRTQACAAIDPDSYEHKELPEMLRQAIGFEAISDAVGEALRILKERVKEQEETNEQSEAA